MELSLREIQAEITKWGLQQFGPDNRSKYGGPTYGSPMGSIVQLCGAFTELAEIMRPMIEMHQGRWKKDLDDEQRALALREAYEDGAADLLIWMCHWAGLNHIDLQEVLNRVWHEKVQHRTQKDWEKNKAEEPVHPYYTSHVDAPQAISLMPDTYRHSCCEAMAPQEDNSPKPAGGCPECKTKFSDRMPKFCPECGYHLHPFDKAD